MLPLGVMMLFRGVRFLWRWLDYLIGWLLDIRLDWIPEHLVALLTFCGIRGDHLAASGATGNLPLEDEFTLLALDILGMGGLATFGALELSKLEFGPTVRA